MIDDWTRHIRRECAGSEARFELPTRPLGLLKLVGLGLIVFDLVFLAGPMRSLWEAARKGFGGSSDNAQVLPVVFLLLFVVAGSLPLLLGLAILFGRCRVEWKDGQLRCTEIIGPLRWTRRLPRRPIRKLEVTAATAQSGKAAPRELERFSSLRAEFEDGSKKMLVLGYPKDWLLGLAQELSGYVGAKPVVTPSLAIGSVESASGSGEEAEALERPAGSKVQLEEHATGLRLTVPPAGIWRGSKGLFLFALMWCGFMVVFTTLMSSSALKNKKVEWGPVAFLIGFWAIGFGILAAAVHLGRRTATLTAAGGQLRVETKGLVGAKQWEWRRGELAAIRADASGMEVNERPLIELQIHPVAGKKVGLLAGRDEAELRWIASHLRAVLNVPAR